MDCLSNDLVVDYLRGGLSGAARSDATAHVELCDDCRALLAALSETALASGRALPPPEPEEVRVGFERLPRDTRLGRYVIGDVIGAGGMGIVYRATDPHLNRDVALKLLRHDASASERGQLQARLEREARSLAQISHPNVISVFDVGSVDGHVFVAMELVEGTTLRAWLAEKRRPWREVRQYFSYAGRGLAAAHGAGIVHRDFKPDNVLVGRDGRVRVTDFGLARAEEPPLVSTVTALAVASTEAGQLGTPAYMAPEQLAGENASFASDQFNFALSLYEGLYGERPFEGRSMHELLSAIRAGRVRPPPAGTEVPGAVRKIILTALAASPADRWPDMTALLVALQWEPPRRTRLAAAVTAGCLLAGGSGVTVWRRVSQRDACLESAQRIHAVWNAPRRAALQTAALGTRAPFAKAAWARTQTLLDRYATGWEQASREACDAAWARSELSPAALSLELDCLSSALDRFSALCDRLEHADSRVVQQVVLATYRLPLLGACTDPKELELAAARAPVLARRELSERLAVIQARNDTGDVTGALPLAVQLSADAASEPPAFQAKVQYTLGALYTSSGDKARAKAAFQETARLAELTRDDVMKAQAWQYLAYVQSVMEGRLDDAEQSLRLATAIAEHVPHDRMLHATLFERLGLLESTRGRYVEARAHLQRALALRRALNPGDSPQTATCLSNQALVEVAAGRYGDATRLFGEAAAMTVALFDEWHPDHAHVLANLGAAQRELGRLDEALASLTRAHEVRVAALGPDHFRTLIALYNMGETLAAMGRTSEALETMQRALEIRRKVGEDSPFVAAMLRGEGSALSELGRHAEADTSLQAALAIASKTAGPESAEAAQALWELGRAAQRRGRFEDALALHRRALAAWEKAVAADHVELARPLLGIGTSLLGVGKPAEAVALLERATSLRAAAQVDPVLLADARWALARALPASDGERAAQLAREALQVFAAASERRGRDLASLEAWLAARPVR